MLDVFLTNIKNFKEIWIVLVVVDQDVLAYLKIFLKVENTCKICEQDFIGGKSLEQLKHLHTCDS